MLGLVGAEPPPTQIGAHRRAGQPDAIATGDQLGDRLAGPQKPRQAELIWSGLPDQRDHLLLLGFGERRLLARSAPPPPRRQPREAALPIASDPAVHRVGMHPKHRAAWAWVMPPSTARTARVRNAACAAAGKDRASSSLMPEAYDTTTPFACRSDTSRSEDSVKQVGCQR